MPDHDITLVNVSTPLPGRRGKGMDVYAPLGCLYLISAIENAGFDVDFRDYQIFSKELSFPLDLHHFVSFLADPAPIVGVSSMVSMLPFVLLGTRRFKEMHPDCTVILGGPGPSGAAEAIIDSLPWIDVVARGEGEITIVELVRALAGGGDLSGISGITYRDGAGLHHNPQRPRIKDLDSLHLPAWERADPAVYTNISIITGRGCPFRCSFCDVGPLWGNKTKLRSVDGVVGELMFLRERYGQRSINIADDTFDLKRGRVESFCDSVRGTGIEWSCLSRVDLLDEELIAAMAGAGCSTIFLGIESGSNAVLRAIGKRFTIQEATAKVELAAGIMENVITSYIWGFPFETMDDFEKTIFSVVSMWHLGAMAGLKLLSPMPLSRLGIEYRDRLEFSEDLCSVFASLGNVTADGASRRASLPDEFKEFIKEYPDILSGFYYIRGGGIREKADYLRRFSEKRGIPM